MHNAPPPKKGDVKKNIAVPFQKAISYFTFVENRGKYPKDCGKFMKSSKENCEAKTHKVYEHLNIFPKVHRKYSWARRRRQ